MENKIVLISGGLGDIGSAITVAFANKNFKVAISDIHTKEDAETRLSEFRKSAQVEIFYHKADVSKEDEVENWINAVVEKWGVPQIVVANAGIVVPGELTGSMSTSQVKNQMDVNFWGSYHVAVQASKLLQKNNLPGRIVFIGSWAAERANSRISAYCISKASVRMLCKTLALELADSNILVNEVAPGIVAGGLSKKNQDANPELLKLHLDSIPVHKLISVDDVAKHVLFLSDFEMLNVTGTTLLLDGGLSLTSKMTK